MGYASGPGVRFLVATNIFNSVLLKKPVKERIHLA